MEYTFTKGECYIERCSKNHYEIYYILKDSKGLKDMKYESIMIAPDEIYNRGVMTASYPFYYSSFKKISRFVLDMILTRNLPRESVSPFNTRKTALNLPK